MLPFHEMSNSRAGPVGDIGVIYNHDWFVIFLSLNITNRENKKGAGVLIYLMVINSNFPLLLPEMLYRKGQFFKRRSCIWVEIEKKRKFPTLARHQSYGTFEYSQICTQILLKCPEAEQCRWQNSHIFKGANWSLDIQPMKLLIVLWRWKLAD